jgi:hypothetical protein
MGQVKFAQAEVARKSREAAAIDLLVVAPAVSRRSVLWKSLAPTMLAGRSCGAFRHRTGHTAAPAKRD